MCELYKLFGKVYNKYDLSPLYLHFGVLKEFNRLYLLQPAKVIFPRTVFGVKPLVQGLFVKRSNLSSFGLFLIFNKRKVASVTAWFLQIIFNKKKNVHYPEA